MKEYKIIVIGPACSGKTTLAKLLSEKLNISHLQLDSYYWTQKWKPLQQEEFREKVKDFLNINCQWIIDGNHSKVRDLLWGKANICVWLNYPFIKVLKRCLKRSFSRGINREELYSQNVETLKRSFFSKDSVILFLLKTFFRRKREIPLLLKKYNFQNKEIFEIKNEKDMELLVSYFMDKNK